MNQFSGIEMAKQRQAEFLAEASRYRQGRAIGSARGGRISRLAGLVSFRRAARGASEPRNREWRLLRP